MPCDTAPWERTCSTWRWSFPREMWSIQLASGEGPGLLCALMPTAILHVFMKAGEKDSFVYVIQASSFIPSLLRSPSQEIFRWLQPDQLVRRIGGHAWSDYTGHPQAVRSSWGSKWLYMVVSSSLHIFASFSNFLALCWSNSAFDVYIYIHSFYLLFLAHTTCRSPWYEMDKFIYRSL